MGSFDSPEARHPGELPSATPLPDSTDGLARAGKDALASAGEQMNEAKAESARLATGLAETIRQGAETQKQAGAETIATLASSARNAAQNLQERSPELARIVRSSADALERTSTQLRNQSLGDLVESTTEFAGRHPVAFFGCGVLAGFLVARLSRSPGR